MDQSFFSADIQREMRGLVNDLIQILREEKDEPLVYTVDQVAEKLQISRSKAYELARRDGFPSLKVGGSVRVPRSGLEEWVERLSE